MKRSKVPLSKSHPHLMNEWDFEKNEIRPEEVTYGSGKKVWWVCSKKGCEYCWEASICSRTKSVKLYGCPACSGRAVTDKNRLSILFPELSEEWDLEKNEIRSEDVTKGSSKRVWWKCKACGHGWVSIIRDRTRGTGPSGCPLCAKETRNNSNIRTRVSSRGSFCTTYPHLLSEWYYEKNEIKPEEVTCGSGKKVWWKCNKEGCGYVWKTQVRKRVRKVRPTGCPECGMKKQSKSFKKNRIARLGGLDSTHPHLLEEWDYFKNMNLRPEDLAYGNHRKVWWVCKVCEHSWEATLCSRTHITSPAGCPVCGKEKQTKSLVQTKIAQTGSLYSEFPKIVKEWHPIRNGILDPKNFTPHSNKKVWWKCLKCANEWKTFISVRTKKVLPTGCPICAKGNISKVSQEWLDSLKISQEFREYYIKELSLRVDGYDPETNTVYEFFGDFWHGNPDIYSPEKVNKVCKKTFGKLYEKTFRRLRLLEEVGYKVVFIWEKDFRIEIGKVK